MLIRITASVILLVLVCGQTTAAGQTAGQLTPAQEDSVRASRWVQRDTWQRPDSVLTLIAVEPGSVVADLGAGRGYFTHYLANAVGPEGRVLALDVRSKSIGILERAMEEYGHDNIETRLIPPDEPGLDPGEADLIFICKTWHFFPERFCYAKRLARVLTPASRVVVINSGLEAKTVATRRKGTTDRFEVQRQAEAAGMKLIGDFVLGNQFIAIFQSGRAEVFKSVQDFEYVSSELALARAPLDSLGLKCLAERGFSQVIDICDSVDPLLPIRSKDTGLQYSRIVISDLAKELVDSGSNISIVLGESKEAAKVALREVLHSGELELNSCEAKLLLGREMGN